MKEISLSANTNNGTRRRGPPFFHCVMGGYGPNGPMPSVSHIVPSQPRTPRFIPALPLAFPLGLDGMYSVMMSNTLMACSPGATVTTSRLFRYSRFVPYKNFEANLIFSSYRAFRPTASLLSGRCYGYSNAIEGRLPVGSAMNTYRGGAGMTRMGRFLVATGQKMSNVLLEAVNKPFCIFRRTQFPNCSKFY